jgi:hydrogenase maturation protease
MVDNCGSCDSLRLRPQAPIRVIGIGNETRSDDGVGLWIARRLKAANLPGARVELETGDAAALVASWAATDAVILIDAVNSGRCTSPGKIYRFNDSGQRIPDCFLSPSTHRLGLARAMKLARALDRLPRRFILYGIEGFCFDFGFELTPPVRKAAARVIPMVIEDIFRFSGKEFIFADHRCYLTFLARK